MAKIQVVSSRQQAPAQVVAELLAALPSQAWALCVLYAPESLGVPDLAQGLRAGLPKETRLLGVSTAGEVGEQGYAQGLVQLVAFPASDFRVATVLLPDLAESAIAADTRALEQAYAELLQQNSPDWGTFALMFIDGLSQREEAIGHAVQLVLGDVPVLGGSAGDALQFQRTWVMYEDGVFSQAAVVALVSTRQRFQLFKTQHFARTDTRMVVTGARPEERIVTEINGLPAAKEYARLVGVSGEVLDSQVFAAYPVVVRIGGAEYVRSIQRVNDDLSLSFFCAIDEGIVLTLARSVNALASIEQALSQVTDELGVAPDCVLVCDCILRRLEFAQRDILDDVGQVLQRHHVVGFSSYGELYKGVHVNQTLSGIAFSALPKATAGVQQ